MTCLEGLDELGLFSLKERRLRKDLISLQIQRVVKRKMINFFLAIGDRTSSNGLQLQQGKSQIGG